MLTPLPSTAEKNLLKGKDFYVRSCGKLQNTMYFEVITNDSLKGAQPA